MTSDFYQLFGQYAEGASSVTAGKPLFDGNIDQKASSFPKMIREQNHWLNVNDTNIPTIVRTNTVKTIGVSISTQVESPSVMFNREAEALIEEHSNKGVGELKGKHHFNKSCRVISDFDLLDGGVIVRHHYNAIWPIPYKYELVGVDMIDVSKTQYAYEEERKETTINGLVRNKWGQITHIWIYTTEDKRISKKISYENFIYYSDTWVSIDQQTAVSKLVSMLKTLDQSLQYGVAELDSAIEAAKAGAYLQSQAYNEVMKVVSAAVKAKVSNVSDPEAITAVVDIVKPIMKQLANIGVKPHGVTPIASEDNVIFDNSKKDSQYQQLTDNTEMKMASSQGLSDVGVFKKASDVNYSGIKATMEMDQLTCDIRFDDIKNVILYDIHTRLIKVGVQTGRITERAAYWKNPYSFNKFRYLRQNKIDIEPAKNALANKTNIALGVKTEAQIVESAEGVKYEDFLKKKYEQEDLKFNMELEAEIRHTKKRKDAYEKANLELPEENISTGKDIPKEDDKSTQALLDVVVDELKITKEGNSI